VTKANQKTKDPSWQLQEAKSRLSQVVDHALREGPQTITLRGKPTVVVISFDEFQNLTRPSTSLREFFRQSPDATNTLNGMHPFKSEMKDFSQC